MKTKTPPDRLMSNGVQYSEVKQKNIAPKCDFAKGLRGSEKFFQKRKIDFKVTRSGDIETQCPRCRGRLLVNIHQPWAICMTSRCGTKSGTQKELFEIFDGGDE